MTTPRLTPSMRALLECAGCDQWATILDDVGLCAVCGTKFDRDPIRQRAWDYSTTAFACDPKDYEALRQAVIEQYGPAYELLAPPEIQPPRPQRPPRKRQRRH